MKKFVVDIKYEVTESFTVEANSVDEAENIILQDAENGMLILGSNVIDDTSEEADIVGSREVKES